MQGRLTYLLTVCMTFRFRLHHIAVLLSLLAAFSSLGGAWIVAQGVAWSRMAVTYSQKRGIKYGIKSTFDGKHPCKICHQIAKHQDKSSNPENNGLQLKFEVYSLPLFSRDLAPIGGNRLLITWMNADFHSIHQRPSVPPPQVAFS
jgi:hypothetical protein